MEQQLRNYSKLFPNIQELGTEAPFKKLNVLLITVIKLIAYV